MNGGSGRPTIYGLNDKEEFSMELSKTDLSAFLDLLNHLETTNPPTAQEIASACGARKVDFLTMSEAEIQRRVHGPIPQALSFLQRPDAKEYIKSIQNDLDAQVQIVSDLLTEQRQFGEFPAPHYSRRIGVILRKAKRKDLSDRFQAAYNRHTAR